MSGKSRLLFIVLVFSIIVAGFYFEETRISQYEHTVAVLEGDVASLNRNISILEVELQNTTEELVQTKKELSWGKNRISELEEENLELRRTSSVRFAVAGVDGKGRGSIIPMYVTVTPGRGSVFLDVANIVFDESLQSSAQTAVMVARYNTRVNLADKDVKIVIKPEAEGVVYTIGGGSGGAAMATAVIAALKGVNLTGDVLMTGTIRPDGTIGRISGQKAKAEAAKEYGAKTFLVPSGQKVSVEGIDVQEVRNIEQVLKYVLPGS